jgi:hypothetical protein
MRASGSIVTYHHYHVNCILFAGTTSDHILIKSVILDYTF